MLFYLHPYSFLFTLSLLPRRGWLVTFYNKYARRQVSRAKIATLIASLCSSSVRLEAISHNFLFASVAFIYLSIYARRRLNINFSVLMSYYLTKISPMIPITALVTFSSVERAMMIYLCCYTHTYTSISELSPRQKRRCCN